MGKKNKRKREDDQTIQHDTLPPKPLSGPSEEKSIRNRLFVGNLPKDCTNEALRQIFNQYDPVECYVVKDKNYGFVQLKSREMAETVRADLNGKVVKGPKPLIVNFVTPAGTIRVKNLSPFISNEVLYQAFSTFGEVVKAVVLATPQGTSSGEGIVEFSSKKAYHSAVNACTQGCFVLSNALQPVTVEEYIKLDDEKGIPEASLNKSDPAFEQDRKQGPRLLQPGTFEYDYAVKWKQLDDLENQKKKAIEVEFQQAKARLHEDIEAHFYEHQAQKLREQLKQLEEKTSHYYQSRGLMNPPQIQEELNRLKMEEDIRKHELMLGRENGLNFGYSQPPPIAPPMPTVEIKDYDRKPEPLVIRYNTEEFEPNVMSVPPNPLEPAFMSRDRISPTVMVPPPPPLPGVHPPLPLLDQDYRRGPPPKSHGHRSPRELRVIQRVKISPPRRRRN